MHRTRITILVASAAMLLGVAVGTAHAGEPSTVTVRVEGSSKTLLHTTSVTTTTTPVEPQAGHPCPGTNAIGALQLATGGEWSGKWFGGSIKEGKFKGLGYSVEKILGESHPLTSAAYWAFWINGKYSEEGVCSAELGTGDSLLFAPVEGSAIPDALKITAPASALTGEEVTATVVSYDSSTGEPSPADGATIHYEGKTAKTESAGHATLTFSTPGNAELLVEATESVRAETSVCVHESGEETCGADPAAPAGGGSKPPSTAGVEDYSSSGAGTPSGSDAITATLSSIRNGHRYRRGHAPRLLAGRIQSSLAIDAVSLRLSRRSFKGRCYSYEGRRERFLRTRCGHGSFFKVGSGSSFSYLLPERLPAGRYALELQASDVAGGRCERSVTFDVA